MCVINILEELSGFLPRETLEISGLQSIYFHSHDIINYYYKPLEEEIKDDTEYPICTL